MGEVVSLEERRERGEAAAIRSKPSMPQGDRYCCQNCDSWRFLVLANDYIYCADCHMLIGSMRAVQL